MPTTKSAEKRLRQNIKRRALNRSAKATLKTYVRRVRDAVKAGDHQKADAEFRLTAKKLDQAAAKRVIHKNAASRTKSRLQHLMKTAKTATTAKSP